MRDAHFPVKHPVSERTSAIYHGLLAGLTLLGLLAHTYAMFAHWADRDKD